MVARMVAMGPASVTDATRLATLPESAPATLVSHILAAAGKLYLPEEAAEIMEEGESGEAAKNMQQGRPPGQRLPGPGQEDLLPLLR